MADKLLNSFVSWGKSFDGELASNAQMTSWPFMRKHIGKGPQIPRIPDYGAAITNWMKYWGISKEELLSASNVDEWAYDALMGSQFRKVFFQSIVDLQKGIVKLEENILKETPEKVKEKK